MDPRETDRRYAHLRASASRFARRLGVRDASLRDDVAQEVALRAWSQRELSAAWMRTVTRRHVIDALRRGGSWCQSVDLDGREGGPGFAASDARFEARWELRAVCLAAQRLSPPLREVFELVCCEGRSIERAAVELGVTRAVVDKRLERLRRQLERARDALSA